MHATITVHDGNGNNPRTLTRDQYEALKSSGMLWEFHPDAPLRWEDYEVEKCEGCEEPATKRDSEGIALCDKCYNELPPLDAED